MKNIMKIFIQMFPMVVKILISLGKIRSDVPNGTTQGWVYPPLVSSIN
jgi:hypothetical protein